MTTPLKDSCRKHSLIVIECAVEWGPRHVWGFHRQETGVESESPRPSSGGLSGGGGFHCWWLWWLWCRGLWGLWCWGPHWSRSARRARIRKVAKPCKLDRSCTALKVAFGSVLSSFGQIIPSPLCSHRFFIRGIPCLLVLCQLRWRQHHRVHSGFPWLLPISFECKGPILRRRLVRETRHTIRTKRQDVAPFGGQWVCARFSFLVALVAHEGVVVLQVV